MKIKEALSWAKNLLGKEHKQANFILSEYLQKDHTWLFLHAEDEIDEKPYFELIKRFKKGEPFEYIFEKASFYGLDFKVQSGVLIPRFDSEILLELCLKELQNKKYENILEIGFGSGILSIVLAKLTGAKIKACDLNEKAFTLASLNAKTHEVEHLIDFVLSDFKSVQGEFDFIFSNPPYIARAYPLDIWVQHEPQNALIGGEKGFEFLQELIVFARTRKTKFLACEFGYDQKEILHKILRNNDFRAEFYKDTAGHDRAFIAHAI